MRVIYYAGNKRKSTASSLLSHNVVVTTYGTLTAEQNRKAKKSCDEDQPLLAHRWLRIVLDEGMLWSEVTGVVLTRNSPYYSERIYKAVHSRMLSQSSTSLVFDWNTYPKRRRRLRFSLTISSSTPT